MIDHWDIWDFYKALMAVGAGMILGLERELKDKVAGLKTITIICLGATLFGILSYKVDGDSPTRIASYVVSGVGFIGAGAIFKDGFSISGLTTAGIIWLAAAVGLAIGFGEYYMAATFMAGSLVVILVTPFINRIFKSKKITRTLEVQFSKSQLERKDEIITGLRKIVNDVEEKKLSLNNDELNLSLEIVLTEEKIHAVQQYLLGHPDIRKFSF